MEALLETLFVWIRASTMWILGLHIWMNQDVLVNGEVLPIAEKASLAIVNLVDKIFGAHIGHWC